MMEQTLGLLGGGSGDGPGGNGSSSDGSGGGLSNEKDYMGFSSEASSYENEGEIELGLGLSLMSSGTGTKNKGSLWGECRRILTAKYLPSDGYSRRGACGVSGTKRAADFVSPAENGPASTSVSCQVVGWPPIKAYRMNSLVNQSKAADGEQNKRVSGNEKKEILKKKLDHGNHRSGNPANIEKGHLGYIKVNMDGLPIGRKVDLNAHSCYESLAQALEDMFFNSIPSVSSINGEKERLKQRPKLLDETSEYVLTYKDKEGDWMLVGDVPWGMFVCSVKRLRIMRNPEANGIAPTFRERHQTQKGKPT